MSLRMTCGGVYLPSPNYSLKTKNVFVLLPDSYGTRPHQDVVAGGMIQNLCLLLGVGDRLDGDVSRSSPKHPL